jgi:hypothetical protein
MKKWIILLVTLCSLAPSLWSAEKYSPAEFKYNVTHDEVLKGLEKQAKLLESLQQMQAYEKEQKALSNILAMHYDPPVSTKKSCCVIN